MKRRTDRPTNQPTHEPTDRRTDRIVQTVETAIDLTHEARLPSGDLSFRLSTIPVLVELCGNTRNHHAQSS